MLILQIGHTPLSIAAYNGHLAIVQYLITVDCVKETRSNVMISSLKYNPYPLFSQIDLFYRCNSKHISKTQHVYKRDFTFIVS